eukprot:TRINITY_DN8348_c0_g1_i4.p1 TRINITY_DN8348_c0_g1~~TRINITY_DN8348_c0_g1_i4.p1  ORF type:complete len:370 (-),score=68.85 TRINITY_DN8348_c0_g1_i4:11-1060(-)
MCIRDSIRILVQIQEGHDGNQTFKQIFIQKMDQTSRSILITGANRGLGRTCLEFILKRHPTAEVIGTVRDAAKGEAALKELQAQYPSARVTFRELEVGKNKSVDEFVAWVASSNISIDVLVNNAAISSWEVVRLKRGTLPDPAITQELMQINVLGTIYLTEELLPYLTSDAKIINVSSQLGSLVYQGSVAQAALTNPDLTSEQVVAFTQQYIDGVKKGDIGDWWVAPYATSKALINAWHRIALLRKLKPQQLAIIVSPGWCQTEMGGSAAPRTPEEGAEVYYYAIFGIPFGSAGAEYNGRIIGEDQKLTVYDEPKYAGFPDYLDDDSVSQQRHLVVMKNTYLILPCTLR